jgi:tRNA modification GTPase
MNMFSLKQRAISEPPAPVSSHLNLETFMTVLTPDGRGAIGVVQIWGGNAVGVADSVFRPARGDRLAAIPPGRLRLGRIGRGVGDEVVAVRLETEPPSVEIQCHGGTRAVTMVIEALQDAGARLAGPERWCEQQARSPIQAAALADLACASTLRTAEILLEQSQGALDRELAELILEIFEHTDSAPARLDRLIQRGQVGLRLLSGWRVVIVGRPNVGKSRLLNALAGYERAIVDPTPGTTRDVVSVQTALDGWPVTLIDTAGVRTTDDAIETLGIERALREKEAAELVLKVLDRSEPLQSLDRELVASSGQSLLVINKSDLPAVWGPEALGVPSDSFVSVSSQEGSGIDGLIARMSARIVSDPPEPGVGVPFRLNHLEHLMRARDDLQAGAAEQAARQLESLLARG